MQNILGATLVALLLMTSAAQSQEAPARGQITVTGEGQVMAAPDLAQITLGVVTEADSAAQALRENSAAMSQVFALLEQAGIAAKDMQTSQLNLSPIWENAAEGQRPRIIAYNASNMLTATLRDLDNLGAVLDAVVQDGANTLNGIQFGLSNPKPMQEAARNAAVQDARTKAEVMVRAAGAKLGIILTMAEGGSYSDMAPMARLAASGDAVPLAAGEVGTSAQVTITYEFVQ